MSHSYGPTYLNNVYIRVHGILYKWLQYSEGYATFGQGPRYYLALSCISTGRKKNVSAQDLPTPVELTELEKFFYEA